MPVKDFEDDHGAVHHLAADLLLQVEGLRRGDLVVDQDDVGGLLLPHQPQLLPLPGPEVRRRVKAWALLREHADHLEPQRLRELAQLGQRCIELLVAHAGQLHGRYDGAGRLLVDLLHRHAWSLSGKPLNTDASHPLRCNLNIICWSPRSASSRSIRFHSENRSQSAVIVPARLSVPFEAIRNALLQKICGMPFCGCM